MLWEASLAPPDASGRATYLYNGRKYNQVPFFVRAADVMVIHSLVGDSNNPSSRVLGLADIPSQNRALAWAGVRLCMVKELFTETD